MCLPRTAPAAGHPNSSCESQLPFQVGRRGSAEGSVMGGQGRDKHDPHGNSVNPSYHATRAQQRQEPAEL